MALMSGMAGMATFCVLLGGTVASWKRAFWTGRNLTLGFPPISGLFNDMCTGTHVRVMKRPIQ